MEELEQKVQEELSAIVDYLEIRLGRSSRWNGDVELTKDASTFGKALWSGKIVINRDLARQAARWRTEIHEVLHTFSEGLLPSSYLEFPGWEEGVVEFLQRLLRLELLSHLMVAVSDSTLTDVESHHEYNRYIGALETLRPVLNEPEEQFYLNLLVTPLKDRPSFIIQAGRSLSANAFRDFQRQFAISFRVLKGD